MAAENRRSIAENPEDLRGIARRSINIHKDNPEEERVRRNERAKLLREQNRVKRRKRA